MTTETPETEGPQDQSNAPEDQSSEPEASPAKDQEDMPDDPSRRTFFKRVAIGGGIALAGGGLTYAGTQAAIRGRAVDMDEAFKTDETFKPKDQRDHVLTFAVSKALNEKHPDRNEQYSRLNNKKFHFHEAAKTFEHRVPWDNSKPGYTQLDRALHRAGWSPLDAAETHPMAFGQPNTRMLRWDQSDKEKEQYKFKSKQEAAIAIKTAARVWGATRCGITRRDKRWDYDPIYDVANERELYWEKDFPFEPKTVIVMTTPADYDCMATAPGWSVEGTVGDGYSNCAKLGCQMSRFMRGLGYHAVGSGNDLGNSVAYAIAAGLGEGGASRAVDRPRYRPALPNRQGLHRLRVCRVRPAPRLGHFQVLPELRVVCQVLPVQRDTPGRKCGQRFWL